MGKNKNCPISGEYLNLLSVAIANEMARDLTIDQLNLLAALLGLVAEALTVIESTRAMCPSDSSDEDTALPVQTP